MQKIMTLAVGVILTVCVSACSSSDSKTDTANDVNTTVVDTSTDQKIAAPVEISMVVGTDSGVDRLEEVMLGSSVEITLSNPNADDEFHLHGYDLSSGTTKQGEEAVISFTADIAGDFVIESHISEEVLLTIRVK